MNLSEIDVTLTITVPELLDLEKYVRRQQFIIAAQIDIESIGSKVCLRVLDAATDTLKAMKEAQ